MKKVLLTIIAIIFLSVWLPTPVTASDKFWEIQSIDTMKYSRDEAQTQASSRSFEEVIASQVKAIAETGATHVAIATPYDDEFVPFLKKWVTAARINGLKVWFRGNFAGWEKWFGYSQITRDQHLGKIPHFILTHPDLFEDGDLFSPCPECENGGPGDPRKTGDVEGFRLFAQSEHEVSLSSFKKIKRSVTVFNSMNGDIAKLIMNPATTAKLGGIVAVDHYVATPEALARDLEALAISSQGNIILGEFGAPIPDLNGTMTDSEQADWINKVLTLLEKNPHLLGLNYWTSVGGSTEIWSSSGKPKPAVATLTSFFTPNLISGKVTTPFGKPIKNAVVSIGQRSEAVNKDGHYSLPFNKENTTLTVKIGSGSETHYQINNIPKNFNIIIGTKPTNIFQYLLGFLQSLFSD